MNIMRRDGTVLNFPHIPGLKASGCLSLWSTYCGDQPMVALLPDGTEIKVCFAELDLSHASLRLVNPESEEGRTSGTRLVAPPSAAHVEYLAAAAK